jgi:hypothetical protein
VSDQFPPASPLATRFSIAAICVSVASILTIPASLIINLPFDGEKQNRIELVAAVLGIILAYAAYRQPSGTRRRMTHVALALGILAFIVHMLIVPL